MSTRPLSMLLIAMAVPGCTKNADHPKATAAAPTPVSKPERELVASTESPESSRKAADEGRPPPRTHVLRTGPDRPCPPAQKGWTRAKPVSPPLPITPLPKVLVSRYCTYEWSGSGTPTTPKFGHEASATYLELLPQGPAAGRDDGTTSSTHVPLDPVPPLAHSGMAYFLAQQGAEFSNDAPGVLNDPGLAGHRPYVAIVDSADAGSFLPAPAPAPRQGHGYAMGHIIDRIFCLDGDASCRQRLFYTQTFPPAPFVPEAQRPSVALGSVADLGDAIIDAVSRWQTQVVDLPRDDRPPLILNMSVGWEWSPMDTEQLIGAADPLLTGAPLGADLSAAEEYAFLTLAWASCQGALPIAAAGNIRTGACDQTHAMAPAAWEAVAAPSPRQCAVLRGEPGEGASEASPGSLVYAVGGVNANHHALTNARAASEPARVLYSSIKSSELGREGVSTMTGTSVATASLSAIAAQLWATKPALDAHGLMREIDDHAAIELTRSAALHAMGRSDAVRRVRAHDIMPAVYRSPSRLSPPNRPRHHTPQPTTLTAIAAGAEVQSSCPGRAIRSYASPSAPHQPSPEFWPELRPQPDDSICPMCTLTDDDSYLVDISTNPEYCVVSPSVTLELSYDPPQGDREIIELPLELSASTLTGGRLVASLSIGGYVFGPAASATTVSQHFSSTPLHGAQMKFQAQQMPASGACSPLTTAGSSTTLAPPVSDVLTIVRPLVTPSDLTPIQ